MKTLRGDHNLFIRVNKDGSKALKIRPFRWTLCILLALAFILSYKQDVQVLEGSMIASRLMGFHMVDLFSGLEVIAAHGKIATNLFMGFIFVAVVYFILGGRSFCSWACPYGLLSEWGEILHKKLVHAGLIKKRKKITTSWKFFIRLSCLSIYQSCRHNLKNSDLRPLGDRDHRAFHADHRGLLLPTSLVQVRMPFRSNFRTPWKSLFNPNPSRHHKMRQMRSMHPRMPCS